MHDASIMRSCNPLGLTLYGVPIEYFATSVPKKLQLRSDH
jgi:hypothetical protein